MSQSGSDGSDDADDVSPPWGSLPVEKFLLVSQTRPWYCAGKALAKVTRVFRLIYYLLQQRWDSESPEDAGEQRKRLVREYVKAGSQRASFHMTQSLGEMDPVQQRQGLTVAVPPTSAQIASVLRPWRTFAQCDVAVGPGRDAPIWLRTCYKEGTDAQHDALVDGIDMEMAVDDDKRLLNDATLYDFGESWERVLDYIPELICNPDENSSWRTAKLRKAEDAFRKADRLISGSTAPADIDGAPMRLIEGARQHVPAADLRDYVLGYMQLNIHEACVANYIIVEDEEALMTGLVLLLFLDDQGRAVRRYRLSASEVQEVAGAWARASWGEAYFWEEAEVGEDYREDGVCGNLLYHKPGT